MALDYSELASPEQGSGFRYRGLVTGLKILERIQAKLFILIVADFKTIEAALGHIVELIAQHVSYGSDLTLVAVLLSKFPGIRVRAPV